MTTEVITTRPQRWDVPFGEDMSDEAVEHLLTIAPFRDIDPSAFPQNLPLRGILRGDTRIVRCDRGDLIVREGDYGNSAFLILDGRVRVTLEALPAELLGRDQPQPTGWLRAIARLWQNPQLPEVRSALQNGVDQTGGLGARRAQDQTRIFLQDVPGVLSMAGTLVLGRGEFFGELAALSRTPRTATVFADSLATLLEIRWQGLRDLMRRTPALRDHIDRLYRENSLRVHLRETPLLGKLPAAALERVAAATVFESYGNFDWHNDFACAAQRDPAEQLALEPLIAEEGQLPGGLLLIRSGFARQSRRHGHGHRTVAYLGKGQVFGLAELAEAVRTGRDVPLEHSLRAAGYVDILRIPCDVVREAILPFVDPSDIPPPVGNPAETEQHGTSETADGDRAIDPRTLDFLVDHRFVNGTQTMIIDLDRCTRCDDCVRACATTHDNNPRFVRQGPRHDHWMIANACMHCVDPVCMIGCPTGAIARDAATGAVRINDVTCIGCGTCANSCPYDAIRMVEIRNHQGAFLIDKDTQLPVVKATKCDLCVDQLTGPACQQACPHDALVRIDMADQQGLASWLGR